MANETGPREGIALGKVIEDQQVAIDRERRETASKIRDIASRIGVAAWPEHVRQRLNELANQLELWANHGDEREYCEHGVVVGDWCEACNKEYKQAVLENAS